MKTRNSATGIRPSLAALILVMLAGLSACAPRTEEAGAVAQDGERGESSDSGGGGYGGY